MTRIKICGLRRIEDAEILNELKPEFAGFVFWPKSKRNLSAEEALAIRKVLHEDIVTVGVFVNPEIDTVLSLVGQEIISMVQLHGSEDEAYIAELRLRLPENIKIIKAFEIKDSATVDLANQSSADMVLVDSGKGSGNAFEWGLLKGLHREYMLAGGLGPDNVSEAVKIYNPYAVDVSSKVETDGFKDKEKIRRFCQEARRA